MAYSLQKATIPAPSLANVLERPLQRCVQRLHLGLERSKRHARVCAGQGRGVSKPPFRPRPRTRTQPHNRAAQARAQQIAARGRQGWLRSNGPRLAQSTSVLRDARGPTSRICPKAPRSAGAGAHARVRPWWHKGVWCVRWPWWVCAPAQHATRKEETLLMARRPSEHSMSRQPSVPAALGAGDQAPLRRKSWAGRC